MNRVLVISSELSWLKETEANLKQSNFVSEVASNGKEAQMKAFQGKFDYIFLDLMTTAHSGLEVYKYLRSTGNQAVLFLIVPTEKWFKENGLDEKNLLKSAVKCLIDPDPKTLSSHIRELGRIKTWESLQPPTVKASDGEEVENEIEDESFTQLKIVEFLQDILAVTDFYIRLGKNKYVKVFNRGEMTSGEQLLKYSNSGQKYIYFPTKDRGEFISYQNELAKRAIADSDNPGGIVVKALKTANEKLVEELRESGIQPQLLEEGKKICQNMYDMAKRDKNLKEILSDFEKFDPSSFSDSFLVSFFSTVICKNIEWVGTKTIETLALGALLHDIGTMQLEESIRGVEYDEMTDEQKAIFHKHPDFGVATLSRVPKISQAVISIVQQHHEYNDGSGFPRGLPGNKIFPLAKIVSLADGLTDYIKENEVSVMDGLKGFLSQRENLLRYEPELVKNLIRGFKT